MKTRQIPVRCGYSCFKIGHVFTTITKYVEHKYPKGLSYAGVIEWQKPVHATVEKIDAYGREWTEIGQGATCVLQVTFQEDPGDLTGLILGVEDDICQAIA